MRNVPRHARTDVVRPSKPARSVRQSGVSAPLWRAARAAYARPNLKIPFEQRSAARQKDWIHTARRTLQAALDPNELAAVIAAHSQYSHDAATGLYRCTCGWYVTRDWQEHAAAVIRAYVLGSDRGLSLR